MATRILIADADESLLSRYREFLTRTGFEVFVAKNGLECLRVLRRFVPDVLVLELEIGIGVLSLMHNASDVPLVPTLLLTSCQDSSVVDAAIRFPMVTHCQSKPLGPGQLGTLIRRVLDDTPEEVEVAVEHRAEVGNSLDKSQAHTVELNTGRAARCQERVK